MLVDTHPCDRLLHLAGRANYKCVVKKKNELTELLHFRATAATEAGARCPQVPLMASIEVTRHILLTEHNPAVKFNEEVSEHQAGQEVFFLTEPHAELNAGFVMFAYDHPVYLT